MRLSVCTRVDHRDGNSMGGPPLLGSQVMIAQWESGCISLSVLSVAPVMIAQRENECISLSPLCGPGHDGSVRE